MKKVRIVKRIHPDGNIKYVIQQKHFLFWWLWVDAWINSTLASYCIDSFDTYEEASDNLCYYDGSVCEEEIIYENIEK